MGIRNLAPKILAVLFLLALPSFATQYSPKGVLEYTDTLLTNVFFDIGMKTDLDRAQKIKALAVIVASTPWPEKCRDLAERFGKALEATRFHFLHSKKFQEGEKIPMAYIEEYVKIRLACYKAYGALHEECLGEKNPGAEAVIRRKGL